MITYLEVAPGISSGAQLSPDKTQEHLNVQFNPRGRKERTAPIPSALPGLLCLDLLNTPFSSYTWCHAEECKCNSLSSNLLITQALSKETTGFKHFKLHVALSGAQRATLVPEETWCHAVGVPWAVPGPMSRGQK